MLAIAVPLRTLPWLGALLAAGLVTPVSAGASRVNGPHETIDWRLTATAPGAPTGFTFVGRYHAAGSSQRHPPYMRRVVSYPPPGLRYDSSVPARCSASDLQLALRGPAACPAGSRLGGGTTTTAFLGTFPSTLKIDVFNDTNQQVFVARSPLFATVSRGRIRPDGSTEFASPTCYPSTPLFTRCPVDDVLQLASSITVAPYTRLQHGRLRSYLTAPADCPRSGAWRTTVRLWFADGSVDTVRPATRCHRGR